MPGKTILVVEDEMIIAKEIESRLKGFGYDVMGIVTSGQAALESVERSAPDLVIMDIALRGGLDGIEAASQIGRRWSVPVVYVTALTDERTLQRAMVTEPLGYIVKPFSGEALRANVEMALYRNEAKKGRQARPVLSEEELRHVRPVLTKDELRELLKREKG